MGLSNVNETPVYTTTLPSTGAKIKYRPFLVAEERALLTAGESEDAGTMYASMDKVVRNCLQTEVDNLTTFDVEFLFVTIRSKSVGETSDLILTCKKCQKDTTVSINLKTVEVTTPEGHNKKIELSSEKIVLMKYPTVDDMLSVEESDDKYDTLIKLSMHSVYYKDEIYVIKEETEEEVDKFVATLMPEEYHKIKQFIDTVPYVHINHSWVCKNPECGEHNQTDLKGIFSFF